IDGDHSRASETDRSSDTSLRSITGGEDDSILSTGHSSSVDKKRGMHWSNPIDLSGRKDLVCEHPASEIHLARHEHNSCWWNFMLPVFIAINQSNLIRPSDEMTEQATAYFQVIRDVAAGMHQKMSARVDGNRVFKKLV
ncbi:MAG: hypothetical protein AAF208_07035, partial [Cyanobacteria bacterium P01_A01_bin.45]